MTIDVLKTFCDDPKESTVTSNVRLPPTRSSVRRSLFGEVDHDESMEFLNKELDVMTKSAIERWNFDFVNEKPLNNNQAKYEWKPVKCDDVIPKAYALSRLPYLASNCKTVLLNQKDSCTTEESNCRCEENSDSKSILQEVTLSKRKLTQMSISDLLKSTKRLSCNPMGKVKSEKRAPSALRSSSYVESSVCKESCYHPPVPETPSKRIRFSPR